MWLATLVTVLLAAIPALYSTLAAPRGAAYLGFQYNTDDHMVYAAWMRQAMDGRFFFDNRFTTDPQPGLTVHLYILVLGWLAKLTGIPFAANAARLVFTALFVPLLYRLVRRVTDSVFATRLAITLTILGGGIGFLVSIWHSFGRELARPSAFAGPLKGLLPIDVWQPEAFVFPSMLTNGLFMVSLCLVLVVFESLLDAEQGWKPVLWGALALGVLMNIHSYDVLTVGCAMSGFAVAQAAARRISGAWLLRGAAIAAGVIPAALWFMHVLREDPVFQARAATETYSANFRQVFFGYALMMLLALPGLWLRQRTLRSALGAGLLVILLAGLYIAAGAAESGYFLGPGAWLLVAGSGLGAIALLAEREPAFNLVLAWAVMGLIALYFPALFQRKLAMGLSIPWALLAALGVSEIVRGLERSARNLVAALAIILLSATSIRWLTREIRVYIDRNVSNTTVHSVYLGRDSRAILGIIDRDPRARRVVLAMPGVPSPETQTDGTREPDSFFEPVIPDLNPIVSGLTGAYTFAGHWSETPNYGARRAAATSVFLPSTPEEQRAAALADIQPDYIIQPSPETFGSHVADLSRLGEVVYEGSQFRLIRITR